MSIDSVLDQRVSWKKAAFLRGISTQLLFFIECSLIGTALVLPMRTVLQKDVWEYQSNLDFLFAGLFLDLRYLFLFFMVTHLGSLGLKRVWPKRRPNPLAKGSLLVFQATVVNLLCAGAALFFVERGAFATLFDLTQSSGDKGFVASYGPMLFQSKFWWPFFVFSLPLILASSQILRYRRDRLQLENHPYFNIFTLALGSVVYFNLYCFSPRLFPLLLDRGRVSSPFSILENQSFRQRTIFQWFHDLKSEPELLQKGMSHLGLTQWHQPLATLLQSPPTKALGHWSDSVASGMGKQNPIVWHILLEGFRSYDLEYSDSGAPYTLAPFLNDLYRSNRLSHSTTEGSRTVDPRRTNAPSTGASLGPSHSVLGFRHVYQSGIRTSQGLSGTLCGLGTLPFSLSITRDLGKPELSCLPKIFNQLGFSTKFFNAVNPAFDKKNVFLSDQQTPFISAQTLRDQLDWPGWGVPDQMFYDFIETHYAPASSAPSTLPPATPPSPPLVSAPGASAALVAARPEYNVILTLSTHSPFVPPPDVQAEVLRRYHQILKDHPKVVESGEQNRLLSFMYSDYALSHFIQKQLSGPNGHRTIFIVQADHTSFGSPVWTANDNPPTAMYAQIPLVMIYPSPSGSKAQRLEAKVSEELSKMTLSQNDIPRLILHGLSKLPVVQRAPLDKITHSLGGQVLASAKPVLPEAKVWGYDVRAKFYYVDANNKVKDYRARPVPSPNFNAPPYSEIPGDLEILQALKSHF